MRCLTSVAYIGPNSRTERPRKTKIGTEVAHVTCDSDTTLKGQKVKGQGHQAALVCCTGRPAWTYSNGDLSICVHDVCRVTTCRPGRGHIVAAARLQLDFTSLLLRTGSLCFRRLVSQF